MYSWTVEDNVGNVRYIGKTELEAKTHVELHGTTNGKLYIKHYKMDLISERKVR